MLPPLISNTMKKTLRWLIFLAMFSIFMPLHAEPKEGSKIESVSSLLGHGFGKIIEIEGLIVDVRDTRMKAHEGRKFMKIYWVGGKALEEPQLIEVMAFGFSAVKIKNRGAWTRLRGYESGGFRGIPSEAFGHDDQVPRVASTDFHFESTFRVTATSKTKNAVQRGDAGKPVIRSQSK